ncbi:MAG: AMP-binding protein [Acidobacteriia bacterium]|nr:AMP-binding protein [Terriglobia bacterium]
MISSSSSIPESFLRQSAERNRSVALFSPGVSYTYAELDLVSNRLANHLLARLGGGPENVGILSTSADAVAAMMGIWKAGKCAVVLTPRFSVEKSRYLLRESGARLLLAGPEDAGLATEIATGTAAEVADMLPDGSSVYPGIALTPDAPSVIIYTSGSTGDPKGVILSHACLLHMAHINATTQSLGPADRHLQCYSLQTLAGLNSVLGALLTGGSLYWLDLAQRGVAALPGFLSQHRITILYCMSTTFRSVAALDPPKEQFLTIRVLRLAGEPVLKGDVEACARLMPAECLFINSLASSEAGIICRAVIGNDTPSHGELMPVGYPVEGVEMTLVDEHDNPVLNGLAGEIVVRSRFLSLGYWARPDLASASFREDPDGAGHRIFRTGDLGMFLPNGMLVCLGRRDRQVKVRGNRVEVQEVEQAMGRLDGVSAAAVVARPTLQQGHQLIAYVVPAPGRKPTAPLLRNALARRLQTYMIPSIFVFMERLPLTHTGKVDRQALPDPIQGRQPIDYAEPRTRTERSLAAFFGEVLAWDGIGIDDDFFACGGDSLLAAQLMVLIQKEFSLEMDQSTLLQAPTIRQLAALIGGGRPGSGVAVIQAGGAARPFFCVHAGPLFRALAAHLGPERPFYGLLGDAIHRLKPPYRLEDLAALYAAMIQEVDPAGPYIIGGWCHAGLVAYAVACQLRASGRKVELLVLFDAEPYTASNASSLMRRIAAKTLFHARALHSLSGAHRFGYSAELAKGLATRVNSRLWRWLFHLRTLGGRPPLPEDENLERILSLMVRGYRPSLYDGPGLVVRNGVRPVQQFLDDKLGWQGFAPNLEVLVTNGGHRSMFVEPNVSLLGKKLQSRLST